MAFSRKDVLGLREMSRDEIELILETAKPFKQIFSRDIKKLPTLRGRTVITLFYEPSTRTRTSFEIAAKWMSADAVNIAVSASSVQKGESFLDTAKTLEAMGADIVILRHSMAGTPEYFARNVRCSVINAGDGAREHPTQGLLDLFTIEEKKGRIDGLKVLIVGDALHSRVAKSNMYALPKFGAEVTLVAPPTLIPPGIEDFGVKVSYDLDEAIREADVVNVLRIQMERQRSGLFPSLREYSKLFGVNKDRLAKAKDDVLIMHPGPANLGVEISQDVADGLRSAIDEQVTNGVAVRMALLYLLSGGVGKDAVAD